MYNVSGIFLFVFPYAYVYYFLWVLEMNHLGHIFAIFSTLIDILKLFYNVVVPFTHSAAVGEVSCCDETVKWFRVGFKLAFL